MVRLTLLRLTTKNLPKDWSNLPKKYVEKQLDFTSFRPPRAREFQQIVKKWRGKPYYDMYRPWEGGFRDHNAFRSGVPDIFVEPLREWTIYRGDRVEVLAGPDKGKQGIVGNVITERNWVLVEGLNLKRWIEQKTEHFPGIMRMEERPLLYPRDVALVDPADKLPTTAEWRYDDEGKYVRVSMRTGRIIPIAAKAHETHDYKVWTNYPEQPKDTKADDVKKVTFVPTNKTFEMDIMEQRGIKEDRVPYPMYWY